MDNLSDETSRQDLASALDKPDQASGGVDSEKNIDALKRATSTSWPEIQKLLAAAHRAKHNYQVDENGKEYYIDKSGKKVRVASLDSWWLDNFDRRDVILQLPDVAIMNTKPWHVGSVCISLARAYGVWETDECDDCFTPEHIKAHIERFPEGQFAAQLISGPNAGNCAGMASTMRTSHPPTAPIPPWLQAIGDMRLRAHDPEGDWLYGVEMAVHPSYQRHGIGAVLYEARFNLVRQLNLRGMYAVGMLMGYREIAEESLKWRKKRALKKLRAKMTDRKSTPEARLEAKTALEDFPKYADLMDAGEYGEKVIARKYQDPTVTMQMNRGFRPVRVVTDYCDEPAAGDAGVLIVWENPDYES